MALTLNKFVGFETQGNEEASSVEGTPSAETTNVRTGTSSLKLEVGDHFVVSMFEDIADAGTGYVVGVGFRTNGTSGSTILVVYEDATEGLPVLSINWTSARTLRLRDSVNNQIAVSGVLNLDQYYYIEVYFQHSASADWEYFIDNSSIDSGSGADLDRTGTLDTLRLRSVSTDIRLFDDFYFLSGATAASDRYGDFAVKAYQNTAEDGTDQGDTLADGTWALVSETPGNNGTSNDAQYQDTGNLTGSTIMDEGTRAGPSGDSDVIGSTIKGAKFLGTYMRGTGGGRTHSMLTGSDETVSGFPQATTTIALTTDYVVHERLVESGVAEVPTSSDFFQMGFSKSATAGQDIFCGDQWAMLGYVPAAGAVPIINLVMAPYVPA